MSFVLNTSIHSGTTFIIKSITRYHGLEFKTYGNLCINHTNNSKNLSIKI